MTKWLLPAALIFVVFPRSVMAQSKESLVGTWKLVADRGMTEKGEVVDRRGPNPVGFLNYTADGQVSVVMSDSGRRPLSAGINSPVEELAKALDTFVAYAGRYTVTGDKVIHHIEACSFQDLVNTDLVRTFELQGDHLSLRWGRFVFRGVPMASGEVVWERLKPETTDK
jgi:hypothetical protein